MSTRRQVLRTLSLGLLARPLRILAERRGKVWHVGVLAFPRRPQRLHEAPSIRKTARALGVEVPPELQLQADRVIE